MTLKGLDTFFSPSIYKDFDKFFVGYDDHFNRLSKLHDDLTKNIPNYPPYNIKKVEENKYTIELAVAGFSKSELTIELEEDKLIVKGNAADANEEDFLFKGIATRNFTRTFALNDHIEIKGADMINGMLKIFLERIIPDHKKPRKIEINDVDEGKKGKKKLLTEDGE